MTADVALLPELQPAQRRNDRGFRSYVLERLAREHPLDHLDTNLLADLLDAAGEQPGQVGYAELTRRLGITAEHPAWDAVERYTHLIADTYCVLGYRLAGAVLIDDKLVRADHDFAVRDALRHQAAALAAGAEHVAEYRAEHAAANIAHRREYNAAAGDESWCLEGHSQDFHRDGTWHDGPAMTVLAPATLSHDEAAVSVRLARYEQPDEDPLDRQEPVLRLDWNENAGCNGMTLLPLQDAERLARAILLEVERDAQERTDVARRFYAQESA